MSHFNFSNNETVVNYDTKDNNTYEETEMFGTGSAMEIWSKPMKKMSSDDFPVHPVDINIMLRCEHKMQHDHRILNNQCHLTT